MKRPVNIYAVLLLFTLLLIPLFGDPGLSEGAEWTTTEIARDLDNDGIIDEVDYLTVNPNLPGTWVEHDLDNDGIIDEVEYVTNGEGGGSPDCEWKCTECPLQSHGCRASCQLIGPCIGYDARCRHIKLCAVGYKYNVNWCSCVPDLPPGQASR